MIYLFLLWLFAEASAELTTPVSDGTQFWATIGAIGTVFIVQLFIMIQRVFTRRWDKQDRETEKTEDRAERIAMEERAHKERAEIARNVKNELELYQARAALDREKQACSVIDKIEEQKEVVKHIDEKIETLDNLVTVDVAAEHKIELKGAIDESKELLKETAEKASAAYEVANTINEKLAEMSEAGLLSKKQEEVRADIEVIEQEKDTPKGE